MFVRMFIVGSCVIGENVFSNMNSWFNDVNDDVELLLSLGRNVNDVIMPIVFSDTVLLEYNVFVFGFVKANVSAIL